MATISSGDGLKAALGDILAKATNAKEVSVGFLAGATYPDGKSVAMVAAIQEFGAPKKGIPPRPFFRSMIAEKSPEWSKAVGDLLKDNDFDASTALSQAGQGIKGQLQTSIVDLTEPALSPVTLMLRGMRTQAQFKDMPFGELISEAVRRVKAGETNFGPATKPLIDTSVMLNSVDFRVD